MKEIGIAGKLAGAFIQSKLTPLIVAASILLGIGAVVMLPREEEPQIIVPVIDVMVSMPGTSSKEIEERVTKPMEKLLWEIPGVEYIYSTSSPGASMAIVRFKVGQNEEDAIVRRHPHDRKADLAFQKVQDRWRGLESLQYRSEHHGSLQNHEIEQTVRYP